MSFDNPAIHIPKEINDIIYLYMDVLQSECAVAHLKNEHIDTSTRWERYMLNNIMEKYIIMRKILNQHRHHITC